MTDATLIARQFDFSGSVLAVAPYGRGLINDTFLVSIDAAPPRHAILQRINPHVFKQPQHVTQNLRVVTDHLERKHAGVALRLPGVYRARHGGDFVLDDDGACWRALHFIEHTRTLHALDNAAQAHALGSALGQFHALLGDLDSGRLHTTLPGFHVTPGYLAQLDAARATTPRADADTAACCAFVDARRDFSRVLEDAKRSGALPLRSTHGDPKLDNFLFAQHGDYVVSIIDLDTLQPGLIHYDVGDCIRSACNRSGESPDAIASVRFDVATCAVILRGYADAAQSLLTPADYEYLYDAIRLIPFELGIRFLTDHLQGDVYFKTRYAGHNLFRARVQFALTADVEASEATIRRIIADLPGSTRTQ